MANAQKFHGYAFVVTVDQNRDDGLADLGADVVGDGIAVEAALKDEGICGYGDKRVARVAGADASLAGLDAVFGKLAPLIGEEDPFLLYYSGHGKATSRGTALLPFDADLSTGVSVLSSAGLAERLQRIRSRRKFIVIDACYSGGVLLGDAVPKGARKIPSAFLEEMASGEGVVVMASSRRSEPSLILPGDATSLFTKHFVGGLRGAGGHDPEGFVRVFDLFNHVAEQVRFEQPEQIPVYTAYHQDTNFPVAFCAEIEKRTLRIEPSAPSENMDSVSDALEVLCALYPLGPNDQELWYRVGGDVSRLELGGSGRTAWQRALRDVERGAMVSLEKLLEAALTDFPRNRKLEALLARVIE